MVSLGHCSWAKLALHLSRKKAPTHRSLAWARPLGKELALPKRVYKSLCLRILRRMTFGPWTVIVLNPSRFVSHHSSVYRGFHSVTPAGPKHTLTNVACEPWAQRTASALPFHGGHYFPKAMPLDRGRATASFLPRTSQRREGPRPLPFSEVPGIAKMMKVAVMWYNLRV